MDNVGEENCHSDHLREFHQIELMLNINATYFHHRLTSLMAFVTSLKASIPPNFMIKGAN